MSWRADSEGHPHEVDTEAEALDLAATLAPPVVVWEQGPPERDAPHRVRASWYTRPPKRRRSA